MRKLMLKGHEQFTPLLGASKKPHGVILILPIPCFHPRQGVTEPLRNGILLSGSLSVTSKKFSEKRVITPEQSRAWLTLGSFLSNTQHCADLPSPQAAALGRPEKPRAFYLPQTLLKDKYVLSAPGISQDFLFSLVLFTSAGPLLRVKFTFREELGVRPQVCSFRL